MESVPTTASFKAAGNTPFHDMVTALYIQEMNPPPAAITNWLTGVYLHGSVSLALGSNKLLDVIQSIRFGYLTSCQHTFKTGSNNRNLKQIDTRSLNILKWFFNE